MRIRRFEEIDSWKTARDLAKDIYAVSATGAFRRDFRLRDQICRAATSIMANIAEGFSRRSDREFVQFLLFPRHPPQSYKVICTWR
jgi:four helix bundle protein